MFGQTEAHTKGAPQTRECQTAARVATRQIHLVLCIAYNWKCGISN